MSRTTRNTAANQDRFPSWEQLALTYPEPLPTKARERKVRVVKPVQQCTVEQLAIEFTFAPPQLSIYDYLVEHKLLQKVVDVALYKASTPWHLRDDAAQELQSEWAQLKVRDGASTGEVLSFVYRLAPQQIRKYRLKMGACVRITEHAFRNPDSDFMQSIGAAVCPGDIADYADHRDVAVEFREGSLEDESDEPYDPAECDARMTALGLNDRQRQVAELLLAGYDFDEIAAELDLTVNYIDKLMGRARCAARRFDAAAMA